jgi:hypothetical protein
MLDLFIQVPAVVRKRLAKRCKEVYESVRISLSTEDGDEDGVDPAGAQDQVRVRVRVRIASGDGGAFVPRALRKR